MNCINNNSDNICKFIKFTLNKLSDEQLMKIMIKLYYIPELQYSWNRSELIEIILEKPSAFLCEYGVFNYPQLTEGLVIEMLNGEELLIERKGSDELASGRFFVSMVRVIDGENISVNKNEIMIAMYNHCKINYSDNITKKSYHHRVA